MPRYRFYVSLTVLCICAGICLPLYGAELAAAPAGSFSIAVIPDTQRYRPAKEDDQAWENPTFEAYTSWIAANVERQRIVFVSHVGDIVNLNERPQWKVARHCMDQLHGCVAYGISVGNHDMVSSGDSSLFQEFFPKSRFVEFDWYGGAYGATPDSTVTVSVNNANSFQLFSAEGLRFVLVYLECNAPDDVLDWASELLRKHSDRRAIITTHMGLGPRDRPQNARDYFDAPKGRMTWKKCHGERGNTPQQMWDKCFRRHSNVFMICCGDQSRTQALHQSSRGDRQHGPRVALGFRCEWPPSDALRAPHQSDRSPHVESIDQRTQAGNGDRPGCRAASVRLAVQHDCGWRGGPVVRSDSRAFDTNRREPAGNRDRRSTCLSANAAPALEV